MLYEEDIIEYENEINPNFKNYYHEDIYLC
jgi:hypothetical protein